MLLQAKELAFWQFGNRPVIEAMGAGVKLGTDISDFGHTRRQRWPAMQEQALVSLLEDANKKSRSTPVRRARVEPPRRSLSRRK
jgi:hypothetical protein